MDLDTVDSGIIDISNNFAECVRNAIQENMTVENDDQDNSAAENTVGGGGEKAQKKSKHKSKSRAPQPRDRKIILYAGVAGGAEQINHTTEFIDFADIQKELRPCLIKNYGSLRETVIGLTEEYSLKEPLIFALENMLQAYVDARPKAKIRPKFRKYAKSLRAFKTTTDRLHAVKALASEAAPEIEKLIGSRVLSNAKIGYPPIPKIAKKYEVKCAKGPQYIQKKLVPYMKAVYVYYIDCAHVIEDITRKIERT
jgi:hypothetical protein